jgi:hypothetical protein
MDLNEFKIFKIQFEFVFKKISLNALNFTLNKLKAARPFRNIHPYVFIGT